MKKEIKKIWVKALRSGKYKKCKDVLHKENRFCVLGTLADLYIKETKNGKWEEDPYDESVYNLIIGESIKTQNLPIKVCKWAGLKQGTLINIDEKLENIVELWELNDERGYSFKKMADLIEEQL